MPSATFTVSDFNLSTSWTYTPDYDDDAGTRYDRTSSPSSKTADKTFTISGIDMSTVNSVVLTWDVTASASGSIKTPTSGYGYAYARVYQGASTSSTYVTASNDTFDLTSYVGTSTSVTCRFYYYPSSLPTTYYEGSSNYGAGSCTGTVYFKNVTLTVTYGEEKDDAGNGLWIGVSGVARNVKNMYIGVSGVARKVKAAWIGVGGVARLFYQSSVTLAATASRYNTSGTATTSGTTLYARNESTGYAGIVFPGTTKFGNFTKATLYVYLTGNGSTSITLYTWLRSNADSWISYNASLSSTYRTTFTDSSTGLHAYDITTALTNLYAADSAIATNGLKVYFRSYNNVKIAGHANTSYQTPYILIE